MIGRQSLDFVDGSLQIGLRELIWPVSHVLNSEVVSLEKLEGVRAELNYPTNLEVSVNHVSAIQSLLLPLHILASPNTGVLICVLVDLHSIISTEERHDELPVVLVSVLGYHSGLIFEDVLIVGEQLSHVLFWRFGLERIDTSQAVLRCTVPVIRRHLVLNSPLLSLLNSKGLQVDPKGLLIISFSEIITVINDTASPENTDLSSNTEIPWRIELLLRHAHAWVISVDGLLGQLLFLQQKRKGVPAWVLEP